MRSNSGPPLPSFAPVFRGVLFITIGAGVAQIIMAAFWTAPTTVQLSVIESMGFAWKAGIGAVFGMLGGKFT